MNPDSASPVVPPPDLHSILRELQYDLEQLQQLSDHSLAFEQELLQLYLEDMQTQLRLLRLAVSAEDWPQIERIAHQMKGASGSIGATPLSQIAATLEQQAKQEPQPQVSRAEDLLQQLVCQFDLLHRRTAEALLPQANSEDCNSGL